ncbi:MAG: uroporphyrinogen-III synthase [Fusobacteriaceae bacterium]
MKKEINKGYKKNVLVTRDCKNNHDFSRALRESGVNVTELPFIEIVGNKIEIENLEDYSAILFNSPNGIKFFIESLKDKKILHLFKIGVVGVKTEEKLLEYGFKPDFMPKKYMIKELVKESLNFTKNNDKILIVTSNLSPCDTELWSFSHNRKFEKVIAYNTQKIIRETQEVKKHLEHIEYITFLSSSTVEAFYESIQGNLSFIHGKKIVSIGEITSKTLSKLGFKVDLEATEFHGEGVVKIIKGDNNV